MNYIEFFNLNQNFTINDIKKSYRKLAKKYHPDVCKDSNMMPLINSYYEFAINDINKNLDIHLDLDIELKDLYLENEKTIYYKDNNGDDLSIRIKIKNTTRFGSILKFSNRGNKFGDKNGDLYIKIVDQKNIKISNNDVYIQLGVSYLDLMIGFLDALDFGKFDIDIKFNSKFDINQTQRYKNKGLSNGDLYISFILVKPKLSKKEKEALKFIRNNLNFNL